jgi:hypothetical protein
MVLTNKIEKYNNYFYAWFGVAVLKYSNKVSLIRAVSRKEGVPYKDASTLVNMLLDAESSVEKRLAELEEQNANFMFLKSKYEHALKTKETCIANQQKNRKLAQVEKEAASYLKHNDLTYFRFSCNKKRSDNTIIKTNKLDHYIKLEDPLEDRYNIAGYMNLLDAAAGSLRGHNIKQTKLKLKDSLDRHPVGSILDYRPYMLFIYHLLRYM